jgi:DNA polymerase III epsilon subunit-like protein
MNDNTPDFTAEDAARTKSFVEALYDEGARFMVFDTETTGLPPRAERGAPPIPADDPRQPRMASFAAVFTDARGMAMARRRILVRPEGWTMAYFDDIARAQGKTPASAINGLTDEILNANGAPVAHALALYSEAILAGMTPIAFNKLFDLKIMRGELRRAGMPDLFEETKAICAMAALDPYAAEGLCMSRPGFVKLSVACEFFGITNADAHDALGDADATAELVAILIRDGRLPEGSVVYSQNRAA